MKRLWAAWKEHLNETHGPFLELVRHFFFRLFDTDLVSAPGQLQMLIVGILSAICSFTMYAPISQFRKYVDLSGLPTGHLYHLHAMSDRLIFTIFPMLLVGFLTALLWQQLFPAEKDYLILIPLPISSLQMFAAKLTALTLFVSLFVLAINLFPSVLLPAVQDSRYALRPLGLTTLFAHAFTTTAGAFFIFFTLVGLQGLLMNLLGKRIFLRVSLIVQASVLLSLLIALPQMFQVTGLYRRGLISQQMMLLAPPFWFHAMCEEFLGRTSPVLHELANRAWIGLGLSFALTLLFYWLSHQRQTSMQAEAQDRLPFAGLEALFRWLVKLWKHREEERAMVSFILKTLVRSRQHKLMLSVYVGIGAAILVNLYLAETYDTRLFRRVEYRQEEAIHTALSAPLVLSFFLLSGMRVVFSIPAALQANWIFRLLEGDGRRAWMDAVETSLYLAVFTPLLFAVPLFLVPVLGWEHVPAHLAVCVLLTLILVELMFFEWKKVPFVCSYLPGKQNAALTFIAYWMAFSAFAFTTTRFESWCLRDPVRLLILFGLLLAAFAKIREFRKESWGTLPLQYEDEMEPVVATLGLTRQ